ncbi:type II toxin-antitoxin system Phd/YefM family antitoxin [Desulfobotulus mexicanus]|uniref:Antitoxin n=1 Tax=Desulfobotulus mexicanus TaxID=2586642 RepID=A0A5Q4VHY4_9BACT|nr:type II toxin-antitoxin system Phd/YefM family antitoxin [Desulfobotulus mexicanus]TYT75790.1 type II toxin-antitoxin system Phd/YefM family antitoxin [Desulfobotulus mexicanus]
MEQINIHKAKTQLSKLIVYVENGNEIVIARHGEPVAKLVPFKSSKPNRKSGSAKGKFDIPPDFFEPLPNDLIEGFIK